MQLHLVDATYELFRAHFAPRPPVLGRDGIPLSGVSGLCDQLLYLLREEGATHVGCATDRVIESFRNDLFPGYKSSAGMPPELLAQFPIAEAAVEALGHRPVADGRVRGRRRHRGRGRRGSPRTRASSGSSSARRTRTWPSSSSTSGSCCGTAAARSTYDDAGVRAKWGVRAHLDPGLARPSSAIRRTATRASPAGARSPPRRCSAGTATSRTSRRRRRPGRCRASAARGRSPSPRACATTGTRRCSTATSPGCARPRTASRSASATPDELRWDGAPRAEWEAFCEEWGLDRLRSRPHRWLAEG